MDRQLRPHVARELDEHQGDARDDCLAKDPDRRPASATELARRLERCEAHADWTREEARSWWRENADAVTPAAQAVDESSLTIVRQWTESVTGPGAGGRPGRPG